MFSLPALWDVLNLSPCHSSPKGSLGSPLPLLPGPCVWWVFTWPCMMCCVSHFPGACRTLTLPFGDADLFTSSLRNLHKLNQSTAQPSNETQPNENEQSPEKPNNTGESHKLSVEYKKPGAQEHRLSIWVHVCQGQKQLCNCLCQVSCCPGCETKELWGLVTRHDRKFTSDPLMIFARGRLHSPPNFFKLTSSGRIEAQLKSADDTEFTVSWYCLKAGLDEVKIALIVPTQGGLPCARTLIPWFTIRFHRILPALWTSHDSPYFTDGEGRIRKVSWGLQWHTIWCGWLLGFKPSRSVHPQSGQIVSTFQHLRATFTNLSILAFQGHYCEVFL